MAAFDGKAFHGDAFDVLGLTIDAWVRTQPSGTVTINAWVPGGLGDELGIDAWVRVARSSSATVDGWVRAIRTGSITIDGIVRASRSSSLTVNGYVSISRTGSFTINAWIKGHPTSSHTIDAWVSTLVTESAVNDRHRHDRLDTHFGMASADDILITDSYDLLPAGSTLQELLEFLWEAVTNQEAGRHSRHFSLDALAFIPFWDFEGYNGGDIPYGLWFEDRSDEFNTQWRVLGMGSTGYAPHSAEGEIQTVDLSSSFNGGAWMHFPIDVEVGDTITIIVTKTAGANAVLSGVFFGGTGSPPPAWEQGVQGDWVGVYGADGYVIFGWNSVVSNLVSLPLGFLAAGQGTLFQWAVPSSDVRALESPDQSTRRATTVFHSTEIQETIGFTQAYSGIMHLYALDWDGSSRRQTVTVFKNGRMLRARNENSGAPGISRWALTGPLQLKNGDELTFWTRRGTDTSGARVQVRLSEAGASVDVGADATEVGDFTTLLEDIGTTYTNYPTAWSQYTITLSGLSGTITGRFGFRFFIEDPTTNGFAGASLDDIEFTSI